MCHRIREAALVALVTLLATASAKAQLAAPVFEAALSDAGAPASALAVGDVDGDSHLDVVTANGSTGTVSVLKGMGNGALQAPALYPIGAVTSAAIVLADLDGDGALDLATANSSPLSASVALGSGSGAFASAGTFPIPSTGRWIVAGDLNGDGVPDLVVGSVNVPANKSTISAFLGNGLGGFAPGSSFTATGPNPGIAIGDFNGDGALDAVLTTLNATEAFLLTNSGTGDLSLFSTSSLPAWPVDATSADFDGDGALDLAIGGFIFPSDQGTGVAFGDGVGHFGGGVATPFPLNVESPVSVIATELNGDGLIDLATTNATLGLVLNAGNHAFATPVAAWPGPAASMLAAGDFDEDGRPDLAAASTQGSCVSMMRNVGGGPLGVLGFNTLGTTATAVVGDWDGDGIPDAAVVGNFTTNNGELIVLHGVLGGFAAPVDVPGSLGPGGVAVAVAYFDGDGIPDLVEGSLVTAGSIVLFRGDGLGGFHSFGSFALGAGVRDLIAADLNGDGLIDFAAAGSALMANVTVALGTGPSS